jgi:hypothetical protein
MSENKYHFVKIDESKIDDLISLHKLCFGFEALYEDLLSKQLNCNGENKFVGFIAYSEENIPAAFYGVYPQFISYNNEDFLLAQSGDTMTHPHHQKKGLFISLAKHTFEYCKSIGILAIFGFPNQNSYPGFINKLDFYELEQLSGFTFYENRLEYSRLFKKNKKVYNQIVRMIIKQIFREGEIFENSNVKNYSAIVKHDDVFFRAKNKKENLLLKINGVDLLLKIQGNVISIGDVNSTNENKLKEIISILKRISFWFGLRFVNFDSTSNNLLSSKLIKLNPVVFKSNRSIFLPLVPNLPFDSIEFSGCDIDVF